MPQMFHMIYEVRPMQQNPDYGLADGAFVNCFVYTELAATAEWKAAEYFKENHWEVVQMDEAARLTQREEYKDLDYLDCYDEAIRDGEAYVFQLWPTTIIEKIRIRLKRLFA